MVPLLKGQHRPNAKGKETPWGSHRVSVLYLWSHLQRDSDFLFIVYKLIETKIMHSQIDENLHTRVHSIIHNSQKDGSDPKVCRQVNG